MFGEEVVEWVGQEDDTLFLVMGSFEASIALENGVDNCRKDVTELVGRVAEAH